MNICGKKVTQIKDLIVNGSGSSNYVQILKDKYFNSPTIIGPKLLKMLMMAERLNQGNCIMELVNNNFSKCTTAHDRDVQRIKDKINSEM